MLLRTWRGWTTPEDADDYERFVVEEVLPEIADAAGDGFRGYEVGRCDHGDEVEFAVLTRFDGRDAVEAFAGDDPERAHVPPEARDLLARYEDRVAHYEVVAGDRA